MNANLYFFYEFLLSESFLALFRLLKCEILIQKFNYEITFKRMKF